MPSGGAGLLPAQEGGRGCAAPSLAARWRHSCSGACRPGPLQIRVCGKSSGAETRPGRGEDGPAGQTDRGPGGRRAAQRSHVPPGSAGSRARGFRHAPQVGPRAGDREGQGTRTRPVLARWPPRAHPPARAPQRGWRSGLRVSLLENSGPPGRYSAPGSWRGQRPGPGSARTWVAEARGREGELAGGAGRGAALAQRGAWQRGGWGAGKELPPPPGGKPGWAAASGNGPRGPAGQAGRRVGRAADGRGVLGSVQARQRLALPKLGAERKSCDRGTGPGALLPASPKLGNFSPSLGRRSSRGEGAEGSCGGRRRAGECREEAEARAGTRVGRSQGQGCSRLCAVPARGAAPSLPWELRGSPLPPTCFLPQPPAPI